MLIGVQSRIEERFTYDSVNVQPDALRSRKSQSNSRMNGLFARSETHGHRVGTAHPPREPRTRQSWSPAESKNLHRLASQRQTSVAVPQSYTDQNIFGNLGREGTERELLGPTALPKEVKFGIQLAPIIKQDGSNAMRFRSEIRLPELAHAISRRTYRHSTPATATESFEMGGDLGPLTASDSSILGSGSRTPVEVRSRNATRFTDARDHSTFFGQPTSLINREARRPIDTNKMGIDHLVS